MRCPQCGKEMFFVDEPVLGGGTVCCLSGHAWWKFMFVEDVFLRKPQQDHTPEDMYARLARNAIAHW